MSSGPQRFNPHFWRRSETPANSPAPTPELSSTPASQPSPALEMACDASPATAQEAPLPRAPWAPPEGAKNKPPAREYPVRLPPPPHMDKDQCEAAFETLSDEIRARFPGAYAVQLVATHCGHRTGLSLLVRNKLGSPLDLERGDGALPFDLIDRLMELVGHGDWVLAKSPPALSGRDDPF